MNKKRYKFKLKCLAVELNYLINQIKISNDKILNHIRYRKIFKLRKEYEQLKQEYLERYTI